MNDANPTFHSVKKSKHRIEYFDIAKGIGILCIILGHCGIATIDRIVFTFHVPIFFLISGYFLSRKDSLKEYTVKRAKGLLIPYIFTSVLLILIRIPIEILKGNYHGIIPEMRNVLVLALYGSGTSRNKTLFGIGQIGAIWFLLALFWALILVKAIIERKHCLAILILIAILSWISSHYIWLPWDIQAGGTGAIFVYIGTRLKEKKIEINTNDWQLCIVGIVVLFFEIVFDINVSIVSNYYKYTIVSIVGAALISYSVMYLSKCLERTNYIKQVLKFYGNNSMIILCFHVVELNNVPWYLITNKISDGILSPIFWYTILIVFKLLFSTVCTIVVLKISFLRKIFGK